MIVDTTKFAKIVKGIASKYKSNTRFDQDDLVSEGMRVVLKAHESFDESLGVPLDAFVIAAVKRELYKYVVDNFYDLTVSQWNQRQEYKVSGSHDHMNINANARYRIGNRGNDVEENVTFEEIFIPASGSQEEDLHKKQCVEILGEELKRLPEPERLVIESLFIQEKSHKETAETLHVTMNSISYLRRKGLSLLSERVKERIVEL